jgi:hypothetical protein
MDWFGLAQDMDQWRVLVNTVMNLRVPYNAGMFLSSCKIGTVSRISQLHVWMNEWVPTPLVTCFHTGVLFSLFEPEEGDNMFL